MKSYKTFKPLNYRKKENVFNYLEPKNINPPMFFKKLNLPYILANNTVCQLCSEQIYKLTLPCG
jgi:hypothetical protein